MIGLERTNLYSLKKSTSVLLFEESAFAITQKKYLPPSASKASKMIIAMNPMIYRVSVKP